MVAVAALSTAPVPPPKGGQNLRVSGRALRVSTESTRPEIRELANFSAKLSPICPPFAGLTDGGQSDMITTPVGLLTTGIGRTDPSCGRQRFGEAGRYSGYRRDSNEGGRLGNRPPSSRFRLPLWSRMAAQPPSGSSMRNTAPRGEPGLAEMEPPSLSTSLAAIDRPRPVPTARTSR